MENLKKFFQITQWNILFPSMIICSIIRRTGNRNEKNRL